MFVCLCVAKKPVCVCQDDNNNRGDEVDEMGDNLLAVDLGTNKTAQDIFAGGHHSCALLNDGSAKCWGYNFFDELGQGDNNNRGDGVDEEGNDADEMGDNLHHIDL